MTNNSSPLVIVKFLQARTVTAKQLLPPAVKISAEAVGAVNALLSSLATAFALADIESALPEYFTGRLLNLAITALHQQGHDQQDQDWLWPPSVTAAPLAPSRAHPDTVVGLHSVLHTVAKFIVVDLLAKHSVLTGSTSVRAEHVALQVGACADLARASVKLQWPSLLASLSTRRASSSDSASSGTGGVSDQPTTSVDDSLARTTTSLQSLLLTDPNPSIPDPASTQPSPRGRPVDRRLSYRPLAHSLSASPSRRATPSAIAHSPTSTSTTSSSAASINYPYSPPPPLPAVPPLVVPEFDDLIQSSQTVKFSLTPTRIRSLDTSPVPPPVPVIVERGRHLSIDTSDPNATPVTPRSSVTPTLATDVSPLSTIDGSPMDSSLAGDSPTTTPAKKKKASGIMAMFRSSTTTKSKKDAAAKRASLAASGDPTSASTGSLPPPPVPTGGGLKKSASSAAMGEQMAAPPRVDTGVSGGYQAERSPRSPAAAAASASSSPGWDTGNRARARSLSQPTSPRPVITPPPRVSSPLRHDEEQCAAQPPPPPPSRHAMLTVTTAIPISSSSGTMASGPASAGATSSVASSPTIVASPNTAIPPVPILHSAAAASSDLPPSAIRSRTTSTRTANAGEIADVVDLYYSSPSTDAPPPPPPPPPLSLAPHEPPTSPSSVTAIRHHHESDTSGDDEQVDAQKLAKRRYSPRSDSIQGTLAMMRPVSPAASSASLGGVSALRRGSEPLTSMSMSMSAASAAGARVGSPSRRPRTHTYDGTGAGGSLYAMASDARPDDDDEDDMRSTVSYGSNVTNYSSSAHPSSIGPPLPTSWSTPSSPPPLAPPHPRVPPLPSTLHALPPASLVSLIQSLHTHLTLTAHELDAATARQAQVQTRLDTLATKAVRKITDLQRAVEERDREVQGLRSEVGEVRGRLERVVGLVASVVPRVVGGGAGNGGGNAVDG